VKSAVIDKDTQDLVTFSIAVVGVVLGFCGLVLSIINSWKQSDRDRVKLRVNPTLEVWGSEFGYAPQFGVEVVNLSAFPITLKEVGIKFKKPGAPLLQFECTVQKGSDVEIKPLPVRLNSREAIFFTATELQQDILLSAYRAKHAYVRTACGITKTGTSPALKARAAKIPLG